MLAPAFSTVACPEWTLDQVFAAAARLGWLGVELRTFGQGTRGFASDPALTAPEKIRAWADRLGVPVAMLATSCRFDEPINPPVLGLVIGDPDRPVREAKAAVDLAATIECPLVRVFGFDVPGGERRQTAHARIIDRLIKTADGAHRSGVRIALENGGSFARAADLLPIIDAVNSPLLGVSYNLAVGHAAGDDPARAVALLGPRLLAARVKDLTPEGRPCPLGHGVVPVKPLLQALTGAGFAGPVVYEWDRAWLLDLAPAEPALLTAATTLFAWMAELGAERPAAQPARA